MFSELQTMSKKGMYTLTWPIKLCSVILRACSLHWTGDPNSGFCQLLLRLLLPLVQSAAMKYNFSRGFKAPWRPSSVKNSQPGRPCKIPHKLLPERSWKKIQISVFFSLDAGLGQWRWPSHLFLWPEFIKEYKIHAKLKVSNWSFQLTEKGSIASPLNPKPSMHKDDIKRISKDVLQAN